MTQVSRKIPAWTLNLLSSLIEPVASFCLTAFFFLFAPANSATFFCLQNRSGFLNKEITRLDTCHLEAILMQMVYQLNLIESQRRDFIELRVAYCKMDQLRLVIN